MPRHSLQRAPDPQRPASSPAGRSDAFSALAGGLAHELNNLLSAVVMSVDLLEGVCATERDRLILGSVGESARRGVGLVRQLLWLARGEEAAEILFQPRHLLLDVERMIQATLPPRIVVASNFAPDLWLLRGDPFGFYRALLDVCLAAPTWLPGQGELKLGAHNARVDEMVAASRPGLTAGPHVVLEVAIQGGSFPAAAVPLLKACGGLAEDAGQVLRVYLPAAGTPPEVETVPACPVLGGAGELILVVEGDAAVRQAMAGVLEKHSYRTLTACDGAEAVALFARAPETVAAGVAGTGLRCLEAPGVCRAVWHLRAGVPAVAAGTETELAAWPAGDAAQALLVKPFTTQELLAALRRTLKP